MGKPKIFFRLSKVNVAEQTVEGIATAELPDKTGEICDYATTVPYYQKWSAEIQKASNGKSLGNVRAMHGNVAAGKVIDLIFDDVAKCIRIIAKIVDSGEWEKVIEGVYTGFSQGGEYVKRWVDGEFTRYTADPSEVSIVDNPCLGEAIFEVIKADGVSEMRKLKSVESELEQVWKAKDGSLHKKKSEAVARNLEFDAEQEAGALVADSKAAITKANADLDAHESSEVVEPTVKEIQKTEGTTMNKAELIEKMKKYSGSEAWDAATAIDALMTIQSLLSGEVWEAEYEGVEQGDQCKMLSEVVGRLKEFIAAEIMEGTQADMGDDSAMAMAARGGLTKAEHAEHITAIHKDAASIMHRCMKCMGKDMEMFLKAAGEDVADHITKIHKKASGIANKAMKMGSTYQDEEPDDTDDKENDDNDGVTKLMKSAARNVALEKVVAETNGQVAALVKRLEHLEAQPAERKGSLYTVDRTHEANSGIRPVEGTALGKALPNLNTQRMSPEEQRIAMVSILKQP